jgi:hypothetical protein
MHKTLVVLSVLVLASAAHAQSRPRSVGAGLALLKTHGFGAVARFRAGTIGVEAGGGMLPVLISAQEPGASQPEIAFDVAPQVAGSFLYFFGDDPAKKYHHGLRFGGLWNGLLGPGAMVGYQAEVAFGERWGFTFGGGLQYLPNAKEGAQELAEEKFDDADSVELDESLLIVQPYVGAGLLYYFK